MLRTLVIAVAFVAAAISTPVRAQTLVESYVAFLSEADHFNSNGQRLTSAAAIIRQDRANFHRFGRGPGWRIPIQSRIQCLHPPAPKSNGNPNRQRPRWLSCRAWGSCCEGWTARLCLFGNFFRAPPSPS